MKTLLCCAIGGAITTSLLVVATGRVQAPRPLSEPIATIDVATASTLYADHDGVIFVDARNSEQFRSACIPGAVQFDYYNPAQYIDVVRAAARNADRIVIYCNGNGCGDSFNAAFYLCREMANPLDTGAVVVFEGGLAEWCAAGLPVDGHCPAELAVHADDTCSAGG